MFCPRCGAEVEQGARYCASCGNELPRAGASSEGGPGRTAKRAGLRAGLSQLIGTSRRSLLVTLGTAIALVIAVIAFIALPSDGTESTVPQDALTKALDASCVQNKSKIAAAQNRALHGGGPVALARYGDSLVAITGEWRRELSRATVPADRAERVDALKSALLEVEIEAGTLARTALESNRREIAGAAKSVDANTVKVESAIHSLALERCGALEITQGHLVRG